MAKKSKEPKKKAVKKKVAKRAAKKKIAPKKKAIKKVALKKKVTKKKVSAKKSSKSKKVAVKKALKDQIGIITHYFPHVRAAVVKLSAPLKVGETIRIQGHTTDFTEAVNSIQIDRVPIQEAKKGDEIGLLVNSRVRQHDVVTKVK
jgi:hypothetical protein